jgi:glycosyltransferase involved in cell wall biosynthesis
MKSLPISVVIPVYNAARYIQAAIASVQAQTGCEFEIIAVDDGSKDRSKLILDRIASADSRLRVISRPNTGIVGALNDGLAAATGEFVARMDADDIALPGRFAAQLSYFEAHPECVALGTDILYTDPEGSPLIRHRPSLTHEVIVAQLLEANGGAIIHPTLMVRRAALEKVGGYRPETLNFLEDLDLYLRLAEIGELANLPEIHLHYRQHLNSINRMPGPRDMLRQKIVNPYRAQRGLPAFGPMTPDPAAPQTTADWHRHWAYDAARGEHWASARKNAALSCLSNPVSVRNWQCLRYVWTHAATAAKRTARSLTAPEGHR